MRKKAAITSGVAAVVISGGLALALNGGGTASAAPAAATATQARPSATPSVTAISRAEAERIALTEVPGGQVRAAELETEHGVTVWSIDVVKGGMTYDLDIDARTGKVVPDRDDDGRDDDGRDDDGRDDDRARHRDAEPRHEAEPDDDHDGEAEHRHGDDDGPGDDHGRHGGGDDRDDDDHGGHDDD